MGIEKITTKIMEEAESEAREILDKAKARGEKIKADAAAKGEEICKAAEVEGAENKEKLISQKKAVADIDSRKLILHKKQLMIEECFDKAAKSIVTMDKAEYVDFLAGIVKDSGLTEGELILNKEDKTNSGEALLKRVCEIIPGSNFTISEETRNMIGGVIVRKGKIFINGTVDSFIAQAKEEMALEVAEVLFQ